MRAFKRSDSDNAAWVVGSVGLPVLMIAMGEIEHGGRLCMTFALLLARDSLGDEVGHMRDADMRIYSV